MYSSLEFLGERILRDQKASHFPNTDGLCWKVGTSKRQTESQDGNRSAASVSFVLNLQKTLRSTGNDQCLGAERDRFREEHCRHIGHDPSQWFLPWCSSDQLSWQFAWWPIYHFQMLTLTPPLDHQVWSPQTSRQSVVEYQLPSRCFNFTTLPHSYTYTKTLPSKKTKNPKIKSFGPSSLIPVPFLLTTW